MVTEIKHLEPNNVSQEWLDMLGFCAAELDRVCGIRDVNQGRRRKEIGQ